MLQVQVYWSWRRQGDTGRGLHARPGDVEEIDSKEVGGEELDRKRQRSGRRGVRSAVACGILTGVWLR